MKLEQIKKIISRSSAEHRRFVNKTKVAYKYFKGHGDIFKTKLPSEDPKNPKESNRRIGSKIFNILENQKWENLLKYWPGIYTHYNEKDEVEDVVHSNNPEHEHSGYEDKTLLDKKIIKALGNDKDRVMRSVSIDSFLSGRGWIHFWKTGTYAQSLGDKDAGKFKYDYVDTKEIIPRWGGIANRDLLYVMRHYDFFDPTDGEEYEIYEYWDDQFCYCFRHLKEGETPDDLLPYNRWYYFSTDSGEKTPTNVYKHGFDRVPFICFRNTENEDSDLDGLKELIDAFDLINSQFLNDQEDYARFIFILSGYGKEPAEDFLEKVKQYRLIKLESGYPDQPIQPSVDTLQIEIPVEAYSKSLEIYKKYLYEWGMGLDTTDGTLNYSSGEALAFRYSLLELKARITMIQFERGLTVLVKEVARSLGYNIDDNLIEFRWKPGEIINESDLTNNARLCLGFTSLQTALKVNPYVEDIDEEIKLIEKERKEALELDIPEMSSVSQNSSILNRDNQRQSQYQINRSESEVKSKEPEKYTQGKKVTNDTKIAK